MARKPLEKEIAPGLTLGRNDLEGYYLAIYPAGYNSGSICWLKEIRGGNDAAIVFCQWAQEQLGPEAEIRDNWHERKRR